MERLEERVFCDSHTFSRWYPCLRTTAQKKETISINADLGNVIARISLQMTNVAFPNTPPIHI